LYHPTNILFTLLIILNIKIKYEYNQQQYLQYTQGNQQSQTTYYPDNYYSNSYNLNYPSSGIVDREMNYNSNNYNKNTYNPNNVGIVDQIMNYKSVYLRNNDNWQDDYHYYSSDTNHYSRKRCN